MQNRGTIHIHGSLQHSHALIHISGLYFTGDGAYRDAEGHYQITGRVDDVINIKGHRIGTAELESCMVRCTINTRAQRVGELRGASYHQY